MLWWIAVLTIVGLLVMGIDNLMLKFAHDVWNQRPAARRRRAAEDAYYRLTGNKVNTCKLN